MDSIGPRRSQPGQKKSLACLLILILIFCLSTSTLAHPTAVTADLQPSIPRSTSNPGGETIVDRQDLPPGGRGDTILDTLNQDSVAESLKHDATHGLQRRILNASTETSAAMPEPFDTSSNNFANASCVSFFDSFLANSTVTKCHAVSLLFENSNGFFHDLSSATTTARVLDTACSEPVIECQSIMNSLATKMLDGSNCGPDYEAGNSVVTDTYQQLMAYEPVYRATCLINTLTDDYCFVDAVTNTTAANDYNVYFIPIGNTLTKGTLTCNECLKATMDIYAEWAKVDGQSLDSTYLPSAKIVNEYCGSGFADTNITIGSDSVTAGAGLTVPLPNSRLPLFIISVTIGALSWGMY
ncbi:hypothetical protein N7466_003650 [Penicillium verhagenii]|uniref:uncharacterized protein n=1 Tax=Penicillium verhagenii TaxID=1562060 RepID=UPI00254549CA|nr:uncharacterized protein N7466_003650 [Penicillium verhagenii]KAJ5934103.1 hypothetical protein N7466_003650 [Penicillium verhagenii]